MSRHRSKLRRRSASLVCLFAFFGGLAQAQPSDAELRAARELFMQAEQDEDAQRWADALEKLQRVSAVRQTPGVRYHVALCEEHLGHLAAALNDYKSAEDQARTEKAQDVLRLVGKRLADLSPRVPHLTLHIVPEVPDATVKLDGELLEQSVLDIPMAMNPGEHRIEATAPNRPVSATVLTMHEGDATVLDVKLGEPLRASRAMPALAAPLAAGVASSEPAGGVPGSASVSTRHVKALVATGAAVVLGAGGLAAFLASGQAREQGRALCFGESNDACQGHIDSVRAWDWTAAGLWVGAATSATFAVLWWATPSHGVASRPSVRLTAGPASIGITGSL
jgi:hypothetical protein